MRAKSATEHRSGLLAIDLGQGATQARRERTSARLREFGSRDAEWEDERRAVFTLELDALPPGDTAEDNVLNAALSLRELLSPGPIAIACDVLGASDSEAERWQRLRDASLRTMENPGAIVVTRAVVESRAASAVAIEPVAGAIEALFTVLPGARARVAPIGRWVAPFRGRPVGDQPRHRWIEGGLLVPDRADGAVDASWLLRANTDVVIVVAPPWTGKTWLGLTFEEGLRRVGTKCHRTSLEHREGGDPSWPDESFLQSSVERVWIVDALDEGLAREADLRRLMAAGNHALMRTVVLTRWELRVNELVGQLKGARAIFELLSLDREAVLRGVCDGDERRLDVLLAAARSLNLADSLSFAEWERLDAALRDGESAGDRRTLRDAVLEQRAVTLRKGRVGSLPSRAKMLEAARWLGALVAVTGTERFTIGGGGQIDLLRIVPEELAEPVQRLCDTVVLARTGARGGDEWTFAAAHLREDLAASYFSEAKRLERLGAQRLRSLVTDGVEPCADLGRVIELTDTLTSGCLSSMLEPTAGEARRRLDALFAVAHDGGEFSLWVPDFAELGRLGRAVGAAYARDRLSAPDASVSSRFLAFRLADAAAWTELAPDAIRVALDPTEPTRVRHVAAMVALRDDDPAAVAPLESLIVSIDRNVPDEDLGSLRALVLYEQLERGRATPAEVLLLAGAFDEQRFDHRARLVDSLKERMDVDSARIVVDALHAGAEAPVALQVLDELVPVAARTLIAQASHTAEDLDRIAYLTTAHDRMRESIYEELQHLWDRSPDARRGLYERLELRGIGSHFGWIWQKDAAWLVEQASRREPRPDGVRRDLYLAAKKLLAAGDTDAALRAEAMLRADGVWGTFERSAEESRRACERHEAWLAARRAEARQVVERTVHLRELVPRLLTDTRSASVRLHVLGDFVFGARHAARNVVGSFDDLSDGTKAQLMDATRRALVEATPAELPHGESFSSTLLDEAAAFRAVALWKRDPGWIDARLIDMWLPVVLFAQMGTTADVLDTIERCYEVAPAETISAVVGTLRRDAVRGFAHVHQVPARALDDIRMSNALAALVDDLASTPPSNLRGFTQILEVYLDSVAPGSLPIALRARLDRLVVHVDPRVARAAASAWLSRRPGEAYDVAKRLMVDADSAAELLESVIREDRRAGPARRWPPDALATIALRLAEVVRVEEDEPEPRGVHVVSTREQLQDLRRALIALCLERADEEPVKAVIPVIRALSPLHDKHVAYAELHQRARRALDEVRGRRLSPKQAATVLASGLHVLRDDADLAMTVRELLEEEWDPTWHVLLFDGDGERRHERAPQALIHAVLTQRLDRATSPAGFATIREPRKRGTDEPDFEVHAGERRRFVVPIEVKWDDHGEWKTALRKQLAERYCKTHPHGVYVVLTAERDPEEIRAALLAEGAAVAFDLSITIHVVVKDVRDGRPKPSKGGSRAKAAASGDASTTPAADETSGASPAPTRKPRR